MNSHLKIANVEDEFANLVDSIRATGIITGSNVVVGVATLTSVNNLIVGEIVIIEDADYKILSATASEFDVKSDVDLAGTWKAKAPYFMDGHLLDIAGRLSEIDQSSGLLKWQKYPLVVLLQDFEYTENKVLTDEVTLNLLIVNGTQKEYDTEQRRENNFKPVLDPIYNSLFNALSFSTFFTLTATQWRTVRRYYWGSALNNANIFNDHLDAIEVTNLNLQIVKKC